MNRDRALDLTHLLLRGVLFRCLYWSGSNFGFPPGRLSHLRLDIDVLRDRVAARPCLRYCPLLPVASVVLHHTVVFVMTSTRSSTLRDRLTKVLPEACRFTIHHLSTPPTQSHPLYAAAPGELAEETYCESQFLSASIESEGLQLQVFAIEVLIYSTEFLTTLFVSKVDSTGYLHLLRLPSDTPSPLKIISTTFLQYLIEERRRSDRRLVLSLFARAQNQYLFPGSIENSHKHVLDDRGLIRWWCQVVDRILGFYPTDSETLVDKDRNAKGEYKFTSQGFLRVPGCEKHETQNFLPKDERRRRPEKRRWHTSDPLSALGKSPSLPERCLIPRFPDDPKARFVEQLDDELPDEDAQPSMSQPQEVDSQSQKPDRGRWRSVKSLEQFWDMMSWRQECSSGRLVGFLWATFQPATLLSAEKAIDEAERSSNPAQRALPTPEVSQNNNLTTLPPQSPLRSSPVPEPPSTPSKEPLTLSQQTPAPTPHKTKENEIRNQPEETKRYYWPMVSRGEVVLRQKDYQRANSLLLDLDYANEGLALESTRRWINEVADKAGVRSWGKDVVGTVPNATKAEFKESTESAPTMLNVGLIRKKKRSAVELNGHGTDKEDDRKEYEVSTLSTDLIRKKAKVTILQQPTNNNPAPTQ